MLRQISPLISLLVAFAATALFEWPRANATQPIVTPIATPAVATPAVAHAAAASAPDAERAGPVPAPVGGAGAAAHRRELQLPDGSYVPALNGAEGAPPLQLFWEAGRPWSPIVGVARSDAGVDWYVHADGSRSTTEMKWRGDLGRLDALTRVAHPGDAPPPALPARR
jgi:hypothetical protein